MRRAAHAAPTRDQEDLVWQAMLSNRLVEGVPLDLDSYFHTEDEATARSLADALAQARFTASVEAHRERVGLLRRRRVWSVRSTTLVPFVTQAAVGNHEERMLQMATRCGAEYDGWEARPPAS
jgi:Regulator of ribonuclease activity B